ncbi:MAG: redoxin domain-containing protein [Candidatus Hydrogenedentota bacterium]
MAIGLGAIFVLAGMVGVAAESDGIQWVESLDAAKEQAKADNKLIFMDVYGTWCPPCKKMDSETFSDAAVIEALENYVPLKVDSDEQPSVARQYGVQALPTLFVLTADGSPVYRQEGFVPAERFLDLLKSAQERLKEIETLEKEVSVAPDNVEKAVKLAGMYIDIGRTDDAVNLLERTEPKLENVESPSLKGDFAFSLGLAYLMQGVYDKGIARLDAFVEAHPSHANTERAKDLILRGKVFDALTRVDKGNYDEARTILTELTKTSANKQVTTFAEGMLDQLEVLGRPAPSWQATWVDGKTPSLQEYKGKVIALAFVEPEKGENAQVAQYLQKLEQEYGGKDLEAVAIVSPLNEEAAPAQVQAWVDEYNLNYAIGIDKQGGTTYELYKGQQTPWITLIGRDGVVHYLGVFDENELMSKLTTLLDAEA